jgi:hypothetical protein
LVLSPLWFEIEIEREWTKERVVVAKLLWLVLCGTERERRRKNVVVYMCYNTATAIRRTTAAKAVNDK